jgi:hypothetical protein
MLHCGEGPNSCMEAHCLALLLTRHSRDYMFLSKVAVGGASFFILVRLSIDYPIQASRGKSKFYKSLIKQGSAIAR